MTACYYILFYSTTRVQGCQRLFIIEATRGRKSRDISNLDFEMQYFNEN